MASWFDDEDGVFEVVMNDEEQYSIWPVGPAIPLGWRAVLRRVFPRDIYWHRSARVDYAIALTEQVFTPAVLATRLLSIAAFAGWIGTQLTTILGQREPVLSGTMAAVAFTLVFALASDLGIYLTLMGFHL